MGIGIIRVDLDGPFPVGDRLHRAAQASQRDSHVVVRLGRIRFEPQGLLIITDGLLHPAPPHHHIPKVV